MQMIANIVLPDGSNSLNAGDVVYAYVGNECRGTAKPVPELEGKLFLSIGSNIETGEVVTFKVYLWAENRLYEAKNKFVFSSEMEIGTMKSPYQFKVNDFTGIQNTLNSTDFWLGEIYPNPFDATASLEYKIEKSGKIEAKIINVFGKEIQVIMDEEMESGSYILKLNGKLLSPGFYYLLMTYSNEQTHKVISKKMIIK